MRERNAWDLLAIAVALAAGGCEPSAQTPAPAPSGAFDSPAQVTTISAGAPAISIPVTPPGFSCGGAAEGPFRGPGGPSIPGVGSNGVPPIALSSNVQASKAPPPISGGTMLTTRDGTLVVASDPDRDQVYFVDAKARTLLSVRALQAGDEPGRLVEDAAGRIHVLLRSGHAVASLARDAASPITRREVCDVPRGIAYDAAHDLLHVACAEGKLISLAAAPEGAITRSLSVDRDVRDVIVRGDQLWVSRFRSSELLTIGADGAVTQRVQPPTLAHDELQQQFTPSADGQGCIGSGENVRVEAQPSVAYRLLDVPGAGIAMLHQRSKHGEVQVMPGGYASGSCGSGIVQTSLTVGMDLPSMASTDIVDLTLAVDMAVDPDGALLAVIAPGNAGTLPQLQLISLEAMGQFRTAAQVSAGQSPRPDLGVEPCISGTPVSPPPADQQGQAIAVTFASPYIVAVQNREPAAIDFIDARTNAVRKHLDLNQPTRFDTGHAMFHLRASSGVACASCHAEAGDDGHVWEFHGIGQRRTQTLRGGILGTEPFHWNGDMKDFPTLVHEVFVGRMAGFEPSPDQTNLLAQWIDKQPALHAQALDIAAAERGKALFESAAVGCTTCHSGAHLTNNHSEDVGTGALLQVPSLHGVAFRSPLMHDGCAKSLLDRFSPACGGGDKHGHTSQLSAAEINDLVTYLTTL